MVHFRNVNLGNKSRLSQKLGMNVTQYDLWKESVRMDAIRLPRHVYHWNAGELTVLSRT